MAMCATLWSWCKKMSYWNSPIISSKYAYSIEIYTSIYPSGVFSVIATWIGKKKKGWTVQIKFVLMLWRSLFEVSDSLFIIVIIVSQIDLKICLVWPAGWPPSTAPSFRWPGTFTNGKCSPYPKHYPLRKPIRHILDKDNHQATSTRIKRQTMP